MTVDIQPHLGDATRREDYIFHFTCFGNFSGQSGERESLKPMAVSPNTWDGLFEALQPKAEVTLQLMAVPDMHLELIFNGLSDFSSKGLRKSVPLLHDLFQLRGAVAQANKTQPLNPNDILGSTTQLHLLRDMAQSFEEAPALDLLSMVDIGEQAASSGPKMKHIKRFFASPSYQGADRQALISELDGVAGEILTQIRCHPAVRELEAQYRGLQVLLPLSRAGVKLHLVDCLKSELCDAMYLNYVNPDSGEALPLDLGFTTFAMDHSEADLHTLYHLGRMAEALAVPFLSNASEALLGLKSLAHLQHQKDFRTRFSAPELAKWRKQRDQSGSQWLFIVVNTFSPLSDAQASAEQDEGDGVWCPGVYHFAAVLAHHIKLGLWPGELLGPLGRLETGNRARARIHAQTGHDLAYEGLCSISGTDEPGQIQIRGMSALASIKIGPGMSPEAKDFVEYTLAYVFFVGCLSRFTAVHASSPDALDGIRAFAGCKNPDDVSREDDEEQIIFRVKPPFTILGARPDVVIGMAKS